MSTRSFWLATKFWIGIVLWFFIVVGMIAVGWSMSTTNISLDSSAKTTGTVSVAGVKPVPAGRAGNLPAFVIQLGGNDDGYWIYRANRNYQPIIAAVKSGSQVTIYHDSHMGSNGYYEAYQLECNSAIIYSKDEYERKEKSGGRFLVLPGAVILLGMMVYQVRKRYRKTA